MPEAAEAIDLGLAFAALLSDYTELGARLRTVSHSVTCKLPRVHLHVHYPAFRLGKPSDADLAKAASHYITRFALHRSVRQRAYQRMDKLNPEEKAIEYSKLRHKAISTFIKAHKITNRNGEAGELMLFLVTEWILEAPQILAKMSLKTSSSMPVYGSDGIHVAYDQENDTIILYFGEAKVYGSLSGALTSAAKSIAKALQSEQIEEELELVERHIDVSGLDERGRQALLDYLDPFCEEGNQRRHAITTLVAFTYDGYAALSEVPREDREAEFVQGLVGDVESAAAKFCEELQAAGIGADEEIEAFLLPLPSVACLREDFQSLIGWKNA